MNFAQFIHQILGDNPQGKTAAVAAALACAYWRGMFTHKPRAAFSDVERLRGMFAECPRLDTFYSDTEALEAVLFAAEAMGRKIFKVGRPARATTTGAINRNVRRGAQPC